MALWRVATFVLESVAFALIGLQLRPVLQDLGSRNPARLAAEAAVVLGAVIVARIVWVFPSIYLPRWLVPRIRVQDPAPPLAGHVRAVLGGPARRHLPRRRGRAVLATCPSATCWSS